MEGGVGWGGEGGERGGGITLNKISLKRGNLAGNYSHTQKDSTFNTKFNIFV